MALPGSRNIFSVGGKKLFPSLTAELDYYYKNKLKSKMLIMLCY